MSASADASVAGPTGGLSQPSGLRILIGLACGSIVLVALFLARDLVGPLFLAAAIVVVCLPVRRVFDRRHLPSWVGTAAVVVVAYLVLVLAGFMLAIAATQFIGLLATYAENFQKLAVDSSSWLASLGVDRSLAESAAKAVDFGQVAAAIASFGSSILGIGVALFFVLAYVVFMAADSARYRTADRVFGNQKTALLGRLGRLTKGIRRYYIVNASFGFIVALVDGIALWALGVPAPIVWAILAFVTNFIPNVGFILGLIPPALLALVVGGPTMLVAVIAIYCVVNVVLQVLVQPKFVSDAVDLTLTLSFFSVAFWTLVIGPLGAILSIPLTLLTRTLLLGDGPQSRWLLWLTGDQNEKPPPRQRRRGPRYKRQDVSA